MFQIIKNKINILNKTKGNLYTLAIILSLISTFFGILREVLVIKILGFTSDNDYLQIYLSLYFSICLLSDPVRLIYLNLISSRYLNQLLRWLTSLVAIISILFVGGMWLLQPQLQVELITIAALNGILGVLAMLIIFHKQRFGSYLSSQFVNIIPNFVLIPAVILINFLPRQFYVFNFLLAFLVVHIIQLILLYFIKCDHKEINKELMKVSDLIICMRHFISILGEQFFQIIIRIIFLRIGEGFVTLLSLFIKCFITARYVFVDSFIGPKLHEWGFNYTKDIFHIMLSSQLLNIIITIPILLMCMFARLVISFVALQLAVVFLGTFYFSTIYRVGYFKINRFFHYSSLITFVGFFDLFFSLLIYLISQLYYGSYAMMYIFIWYILRLQIELIVLEKYYARAKNSLSIE